jgi:hypothetical protein
VGVRCEVRVRVRFSIVASDWLLILLGKDLPKMIMFCDWLSETNQKQKLSLFVTRSLERQFL